MKFGRIVPQVSIDRIEFLIRHNFKIGTMTSFHVRLSLAAAYAATSAGCPLARLARVTSVPVPLYTRTLLTIIYGP